MQTTTNLEADKGGRVALSKLLGDLFDELENWQSLVPFVQLAAKIQNDKNSGFLQDEDLATDFMSRLQFVSHIFNIPLDDMREAAQAALVSYYDADS